jgi:hypothetical protein
MCFVLRVAILLSQMCFVLIAGDGAHEEVSLDLLETAGAGAGASDWGAGALREAEEG